MHVTELDKPRHQWCPHNVHSVGCGIYEQRPQSCQIYYCVWAQSQIDDRQQPMPVYLKPSVCGAILNTTKDGGDIVVELNDGVDPRAGALGTFLHNLSLQVRVFIRHRARLRAIIQGKLVADYQDDALMIGTDADLKLKVLS